MPTDWYIKNRLKEMGIEQTSKKRNFYCYTEESLKLEIEKEIPIPPRNKHHTPIGIIRKTAIRMEINDSVEVEKQSLVRCMIEALKRENKKGTSRRMPNGKFRVWRIK